MSGQFVCASHSCGSESASFSAELTTEITLVLYVSESSQTRVTAEVRFFYLYAGSPISLRLHFVWAATDAALRESVVAGTSKFGRGRQLCTGRGSASVSADGCAQRG